MAKKLIVVIGATGNQGSSVIETFLALPEWKVRGLTRNINSEASQRHFSKGVEMVSADLDDVTSLDVAFTGASAIFAATDFWTGFRDPTSKSKLSPGQSLMQWAQDHELQQGKNIFDAAARVVGLERIVFSALSHVTKWSGGKYTKVYHFDSEARAVEYAKEKFPDLMRKTSLIQIGMFLTNVLLMPQYQPKKEKNGLYVFSTKISPHAKLPMIYTNEDTGPLTRALIEAAPQKHLLAFREQLTFPQFAQIWGETLGVEAEYRFAGKDSAWDALPEDVREDIEEGAAYISEFGYDGGDPSVIHPKDLGVNEQLSTVKEWIKNQDWTGLL